MDARRCFRAAAAALRPSIFRPSNHVTGWHRPKQQARWCVAAPEAIQDRDPRHYLLVCNNLGHLRSPRSLMMRAEMCIELTVELVAYLQNSRDDPLLCLEILDTLSNIMCLTLDPAEATRNTHPREEYRDGASKAFQYVYHHMSLLNTNRTLYEPLVKLTSPEVWDTLDPVQQRNVTQMKNDMHANGITLPDVKRELVVRLTNHKEELAHQFVNVESMGMDPNQVLQELVSTRHKLADVLGCGSYAEWVMQGSMAESPLNAWKFLNTMSSKLQKKAAEEYKVLVSLKGQVLTNSSTPPGVVADFEMADLVRLYRQRKFRDVSSRMSEYLSVANVWRGMQLVCKQLFGVTIEKVSHAQCPQYEVYHPSVEKYVLYDEGRRELGTIYADLIDRPGKMRTAGHFTVQLGTSLHDRPLRELDLVQPDANRQRPVVIFTCNSRGSKATAGATMDDPEKILLSPTEVTTLFHEFGHALHTLFGQTPHQNLAGTRSSTDYVETFSQFLEYYARDPRVVKQFAKHFETGEELPEEMLSEHAKSEQCFAALEQLDQIGLSCLDLVYHGERPFCYYVPDAENPEAMLKIPVNTEHADPVSLMIELSARHSPVVTTELGWKRSYPLQHLSNYPAAYYSYLYSQVVANAIWERFFAADPFCKEAGKKLRNVMALGASMQPREMLATMLGDEFTPEALLQDLPELRATVR
eukprot:TRINITY_DN9423_c0_g1_i1.p1 TRINITY_DN9423_c0_g1~~TRINITY_DN9423_c0_g1_i1.p1  ORF type:complete len:697 (+),score=259.07 TRINITY_DN9423_c0_g1_i1:70-2160(+)